MNFFLPKVLLCAEDRCFLFADARLLLLDLLLPILFLVRFLETLEAETELLSLELELLLRRFLLFFFFLFDLELLEESSSSKVFYTFVNSN